MNAEGRPKTKKPSRWRPLLALVAQLASTSPALTARHPATEVPENHAAHTTEVSLHEDMRRAETNASITQEIFQAQEKSLERAEMSQALRDGMTLWFDALEAARTHLVSLIGDTDSEKEYLDRARALSLARSTPDTPEAARSLAVTTAQERIRRFVDTCVETQLPILSPEELVQREGGLEEGARILNALADLFSAQTEKELETQYEIVVAALMREELERIINPPPDSVPSGHTAHM